MKNNKCICKEELNVENIVVHLAWCPKSYFYKRALKEYIEANWIKKMFIRDPRKYRNFLWTPPY